jgi:hypothetical protein
MKYRCIIDVAFNSEEKLNKFIEHVKVKKDDFVPPSESGERYIKRYCQTHNCIHDEIGLAKSPCTNYVDVDLMK